MATPNSGRQNGVADKLVADVNKLNNRDLSPIS
jgi:hypothetical protein